MKTKIIAAAAFALALATTSAFAGPRLDKNCPNILAGGHLHDSRRAALPLSMNDRRSMSRSGLLLLACRIACEEIQG